MKVNTIENTEDNLAMYIAMQMNENLFKTGYPISLRFVMKSETDFYNVIDRFKKIGIEFKHPEHLWFSFVWHVEIIVLTAISEKITEV